MKDGFLEMGKAFDLNASNIETRLNKIESMMQELLNRVPKS